MASFNGGYDYKLVDKSVADEYICPICMLVLRDPQLTRCGHHLCNCCLKQLKDKGRKQFKCPTCRDDLTNNFFPDKHINRKIKSLQVYCNNKSDGCQWKGDLKDIEDHLQECPYQLVSCSNDCGMDSLQRRHLQNHLENDCPKRLIKCQYCNKRGHHQVITGDHLGVCPEYPIRCTNEGCGRLIPRQQMPSHKASCPKEMISCGYRSVGCEEKMKREEQEEHNEQWRERHLQLAVGKVNKLQSTIANLENKHGLAVGEVNKLNSDIADLQKEHQLAVGEVNKLQSAIANLENKHQLAVKEIKELRAENSANNVMKMKFSDFANKRTSNTGWLSPGFYTSPRGYKICLCVDANGDGDGEATHVSCYVYLMSGEYDDILEWPFHGEVTIEILNQLEDKNHHKNVLEFDESTPQGCKSRVIGSERAGGWGCPEFISHSQLDVNSSLNCQYLKDDTLYFRVSAKVTSNTKPWLVV